MSLKIVFPFEGKSKLKDLVFTILTKEYPLKTIELTNLIRKRYGRSVTFQAVKKALRELEKETIVTKQELKYQINKKWVTACKKKLDELHTELTNPEEKPHSIDAIGSQVTVFTFHTLNELMKFWEEIIDDWYNHFQRGDPNNNCWQGAHIWEGLLHLDRERTLMGQLKKKGIQSYAICSGDTPLDRNIAKFYKEIGLTIKLIPSNKAFDRSYYVGTYGETIIQAKYPEKLVKELDKFFKINTKLEDLNLKNLSEIVNQKIEIKLTVIKDIHMAEQINTAIKNLRK
jgi:hypothetical protein